MEEVFGTENTRAEIIWNRTSAHANVTNNYGAIHDTIIFCTSRKNGHGISNTRYTIKNTLSFSSIRSIRTADDTQTGSHSLNDSRVERSNLYMEGNYTDR